MNGVSQTSLVRRTALGQMLLERGLITSADLDRALASQGQLQARLGRTLVRLGALSEESLLPVLAEQLNIGLMSEEELREHAGEIARTVARLGIPPAWFVEQAAAAFEGLDGVLHCAARDPLDIFVQETVEVAARLAYPGHRVDWHLLRTREMEWLAKLMEPVDSLAGDPDEVAHLRELAEEAPVIELVNNLLAEATDERASDIHLEPQEQEFLVRFRVDGVLRQRASYPSSRFPAVASRVKLISGLDIAERRLPQDGRISMRVSGVETDVRVSAVPGVHGESIVLRLLPKGRANFQLERLGMEPDHLQRFRAWSEQPHGIVLITGPTGSGKSTTLYSALSAVNDGQRKIITVEDPVEYRMSGITQIQTQSDIGYDFARALRAVLRQDPDIIMIGEIRDRETAEIAVQSALTGHMVFSTLHTNDSLSAFTRLVDMGVEPFLVASSVRAVGAQRLVRRLCASCSEPVAEPTGAASVAGEFGGPSARLLHTMTADWRRPVGCAACGQTGFKGRLGIYELVDVDAALQEAVAGRAPLHELTALASTQGFRSLRMDGLLKARRGLTSFDEVLRVTGHGVEPAEA